MLARIPQKKRIILLDLRGEAPENMMTAAVANDALCVGDFSRVDVLAGAAAMLKVNAFAHVGRPQSDLVEADDGYIRLGDQPGPLQCTGTLSFSAVCRKFRCEPPRTRTWNLEIKSLFE